MAQDKDENWWLYDDDRVKSINAICHLENLESIDTPTILFYHRLSPIGMQIKYKLTFSII
jgi:hypothetical protein